MSHATLRTTLSVWWIALLLLVGLSLAGGREITVATAALVGGAAILPALLVAAVLRTQRQPAVVLISSPAQRQALAERLLAIEQPARELRGDL